MKCEVCLELLEEYLDGELDERESREVAAHLITCPSCSARSAKLVAEQEMFARYDRELEMPASLWGKIAERSVAPVIVPVAGNGFASRFMGWFKVPAFGFSLATAVVLIAVAIVIGGLLMKSNKSDPTRSECERWSTDAKRCPEALSNNLERVSNQRARRLWTLWGSITNQN
jgi:anti-sigma factor RsiW